MIIINAFISDCGTIMEAQEGSERDIALKKQYRLIHAYKAPEECCDKTEKRTNHASNPNVNPHMKTKRPSYEEASKILERFYINEYYTHKDCLRDLGFEPESGNE